MYCLAAHFALLVRDVTRAQYIKKSTSAMANFKNNSSMGCTQNKNSCYSATKKARGVLIYSTPYANKHCWDWKPFQLVLAHLSLPSKYFFRLSAAFIQLVRSKRLSLLMIKLVNLTCAMLKNFKEPFPANYSLFSSFSLLTTDKIEKYKKNSTDCHVWTEDLWSRKIKQLLWQLSTCTLLNWKKWSRPARARAASV